MISIETKRYTGLVDAKGTNELRIITSDFPIPHLEMNEFILWSFMRTLAIQFPHISSLRHNYWQNQIQSQTSLFSSKPSSKMSAQGPHKTHCQSVRIFLHDVNTNLTCL